MRTATASCEHQLRTPVANTGYELACSVPSVSPVRLQLVTELSTDPVPHDVSATQFAKLANFANARSVRLSVIRKSTVVLQYNQMLQQPVPPAAQNLHVLHVYSLRGTKVTYSSAQKSQILAGDHPIVLTTFTKRKSKPNR